VPRVFALTLPAAKERIAAARCRLAGVSIESPRLHGARVTSQVPAPGATLPAFADIVLGVS
jgi:hypothetical protein